VGGDSIGTHRVSPKETLIFSIPWDGVLCTSSSIEPGWGYEEFYSVGEGRRTRLEDSVATRASRIWGVQYYGANGSGPEHETKRNRIRFFVGTKEEYDAEMSTIVSP
jgi:hypothetical protein